MYTNLSFYQCWPGPLMRVPRTNKKPSMCCNEREELQMKKKKRTKQFVGWRLWTLPEYIIIKKCDTHAQAHIIITSYSFRLRLLSFSIFHSFVQFAERIHVTSTYLLLYWSDRGAQNHISCVATSRRRDEQICVCIRNTFFFWQFSLNERAAVVC